MFVAAYPRGLFLAASASPRLPRSSPKKDGQFGMAFRVDAGRSSTTHREERADYSAFEAWQLSAFDSQGGGRGAPAPLGLYPTRSGDVFLGLCPCIQPPCFPVPDKSSFAFSTERAQRPPIIDSFLVGGRLSEPKRFVSRFLPRTPVGRCGVRGRRWLGTSQCPTPPR